MASQKTGCACINPVSRTGRQLVLEESAYTTTHTIAQVSTEAD